MNKFVIATAAIAAFGFVSAASAADMPTKAPAIAPTPVLYNWTGFYVGANVGWGRQRTDTSYTGLDTGLFTPTIAAGALPAQLSQNSNGVLGGGTLGYNLQSGSFVYGIEADFMGADLSGTSSLTTTIGANPTLTTSTTTKTDWLATVRGRLGMLFSPQALLYATGGLAVGHVMGTTSITPSGGSTCANNFFCSSGSGSATRAGWTVGIGSEYMFAPNWTAKIEYLHYDLGSFSYTVNEASTFPGFAAAVGTPEVRVNTKVTGDIVRVGVNYKF